MTAKMEAVAQKLENVEHQLETAKVEVTKPFAQEAELAEKLERLTELNALLNMDEKGSDGIDMDDEPETDSGEQQEIDIEEMQDGVGAVADEPFKPTFNRAVSEKCTNGAVIICTSTDFPPPFCSDINVLLPCI